MTAHPHASLRRFVHDSGITLAQHTAAALCSLGVAVVLARKLGPTGQGTYSVALTVATLTATLCNAGVAPACVYHVSSGNFTPGLAARQNLGLALGLTALGWVALALGLQLGLSSLLPAAARPYVLLAAALVPLLLVAPFSLAVLQAMQAFTRYNAVSLLIPLGSLGLTLALVGLGPERQGDGVARALCAQAGGHLLAIAAAWRLLRRLPPGAGRAFWPRASYVRAVVGYGVQAYLGNAVSYLNYRVDVFLLGSLAPVSAVGLYSVATGVGERLWMVSYAASAILLPKVAARQPDDVALTPIVCRHILWAAALTAVALAAIAPVGLPLVFGPAYGQAVWPLWALLPGLVAFSCGRILSSDIAGRGRPGINALLGAAGLGINVGANLVWIPRHGPLGAAMASSLAYGLDSLAKLWVYCRLSGCPWSAVVLLQRADLARLRRWRA